MNQRLSVSKGLIIPSTQRPYVRSASLSGVQHDQGAVEKGELSAAIRKNAEMIDQMDALKEELRMKNSELSNLKEKFQKDGSVLDVYEPFTRAEFFNFMKNRFDEILSRCLARNAKKLDELRYVYGITYSRSL
jgi:hypothetical protein